MKYILFFLTFAAVSCNKPGEPDDKAIETAVREMYLHMQTAAGAGGWTISTVEITKRSPGADKRHYNASVKVSGMHKFPPLADPKPDEPFSEIKNLRLIWRGGQWVEETTYDE